VPDAGGTIRDATVAVNDRGDAPEGPECIAEALGAGALAQEFNKVVALFQTQFGLTTTGMRFGVSSCLRMLRHGIAPAPDGTGRGLDVSGYVTDAPASLQQGDSDAASDFELNSCAFGSHETRIGR
jgi:hypothetical protein